MPPHHNDLASLLAISLWLLAPHCKLSAGCSAMVTLGLPKAASTFPLQPDWIKLANSILNSLRSLRPCLWPSGTGHSWKDIWLLNLCKNWANHFNPICYSNLLSTENRILERENLTQKSLTMRITMQCVISSWERCCTILQKMWHASACGCVNKGLTHRSTTQIS